MNKTTYQSIWSHRKRHQQQIHDRESAPEPWECQIRAGGLSEPLEGRPLLRSFILSNWLLVVDWLEELAGGERLVGNDRFSIDCGSSLGRSVSQYRKNPLNPLSAIWPLAFARDEIPCEGITYLRAYRNIRHNEISSERHKMVAKIFLCGCSSPETFSTPAKGPFT